MRVADFDFDLPPERIAQHPADRRDASRLLVLNRATGAVAHHDFPAVVELLQPGDCLVLNDTRVIPARLCGTKEGGGAQIEILLLKRLDETRYEAVANRARRLSVGTRVRLGENLVAITEEKRPDGLFHFRFESTGDVQQALSAHGKLPLPPYIDHEPADEDEERYQTVYARQPGSAAAPTAGLHFTPELFARLESRGIRQARVTLHIGLDTFKPMTAEYVRDHTIHTEHYEVSPEAANVVNRTRQAGGRIVAVGTTSVRTLESATGEDGRLQPGSGATQLFIYPGYTFRQTDAMLTNFHLPRSTLILLVSAFAGARHLRAAYDEAIREEYRFFSYGDAMFIA